MVSNYRMFCFLLEVQAVRKKGSQPQQVYDLYTQTLISVHTHSLPSSWTKSRKKVQGSHCPD